MSISRVVNVTRGMIMPLALIGCTGSGGSDLCPNCPDSFSEPAELGGHDLADATDLRDEDFGAEEHEASAINGVGEVVAFTQDRLGRVVVLDRSPVGFQPLRLLRLSDSGLLEAGFGGSGAVEVSLRPGLTVDGADRILLAGSVLVQPDGLPLYNSRPVAAAARYNDDGTEDLTFGTDGVALVPAPDEDLDSEFIAIREDPLGGLLVFGHLLRSYHPPHQTGHTQEPEIFVARLTTEGQLDTSFGVDGYARAATPLPSRMGAADIDEQGRALITGFLLVDTDTEATAPMAVWRFTLAGAPDPSFADNGTFLEYASGGQLPISLRGKSIAHDSEGRIIVAGDQLTDVDAPEDWPYVLANGQEGSPIHDIRVWRLKTNGELDPSFGDAGHTTVAVNTSYGGTLGGDHLDLSCDLVIDELDRPLVNFLSAYPLWDPISGYYTYYGEHVCVLRLNEQGDLDPSFLGGLPGLLQADGMPAGLSIDSAGRILCVYNGNGYGDVSERILRFDL